MFIAQIIQNSKGCDYSIACGETLLPLDATTYNKAIKELKLEIIGKYDSYEEDFLEGFWDEQKLIQATLFEVIDEEEMPLDKWYIDAENFRTKERLKLTEKAEKTQLKHLKEKYEKQGRKIKK